jgi:hypothetical protein
MEVGAGLFAYVIQAIGFLHEFRNDQVILKMGNTHCYYDKDVLFTDNVWEYYFHQTGVVEGKVVEYDNRFADILRIDTHSVRDRFDENFMEVAHSTFHNKIQIREGILNKVDVFHRKYMEGLNILSIHKRNSSHYTSKYSHIKDVNKELTIDYYLQCVDKEFPKYDKIFLLTDEKEAYDAFKDKYKDDLIHYNSKMSPRGRYILDIAHGYKLGEDVLIEALLASRTNYLICGTSNVSVGIRIINNKIPFTIIDNHIDVVRKRKPLTARYNKHRSHNARDIKRKRKPRSLQRR